MMADIIKADGTLGDPNKFILESFWKISNAYFFKQEDHIAIVIAMGSKDSKDGDGHSAALIMRYDKDGNSYGLQVLQPKDFATLMQKMNN